MGLSIEETWASTTKSEAARTQRGAALLRIVGEGVSKVTRVQESFPWFIQRFVFDRRTTARISRDITFLTPRYHYIVC